MTLLEALEASPVGEAKQVVGKREIVVERYSDLTVSITWMPTEELLQQWHRITEGSAQWNFVHMIPWYKRNGWEPKQEARASEVTLSGAL